jgi:hypothetical protein
MQNDFNGGLIMDENPKQLDDLFSQGTGSENVDPGDPKFMPLFLGIEEAIQFEYRENRGLTDGTVRLALSELTMNPAATTGDSLANKVQGKLRQVLAVNEYTRSEVKAAVRKILKSVDRHNKSGGPRGYLEFVREFMRM